MRKIMTVLVVMAMVLVFGFNITFAGNGDGNNGNGNGNGVDNNNWKCQPNGNLLIQDVVVYDKAGKELKAQEDFLLPGETYFVYVFPQIDGDMTNGQANGRDKVNTDLYVFFGLDATNVKDADWDLVGSVRTKVQIFNDNQFEKGLIPFTIPANAAGYRVYLKAIIDSFKEFCETNEEDNTSDAAEFWFPIKGQPDFTDMTISLANGALSLTVGDSYQIGWKRKNIGRTPHGKDFLSGMFHRGPNDFNWALISTDTTVPIQTLPGTELSKKTGNLIAELPGTHQMMACADHLNTVEELSKSNNCVSGSYLVNAKPAPAPAPKPEKADLTIYLVKLTEGTAVGKGKYFHPRAYPKNIGKVFPSSNSVTKFEFSGPGTGGQWVKCAERSQSIADYYPLRLFIATVDDNVCQAPNVAGTYTVRACADSKNQVLETNETNNCTNLTFTVK